MAAATQNVLDTWFKDQKDYLHNDKHVVSRVLGSAEQKTKIKRENFMYVLMIAFAVYLIFGNFASTVCNFAGFAYPAYVSMKAVESRNLADDTQWLTYWCVFAVFAMLDTVSEAILGWFPIYWLAKFIFLVWLYLPSTRGAQKVYKMFLEPFMTKYSKSIDKAGETIEREFKGFAQELKAEIEGLKERIDSISHEALQNSSNNKQANGHGYVEPQRQPYREEPQRQPYKEEPKEQSHVLHPNYAVQPSSTNDNHSEPRPTSLLVQTPTQLQEANGHKEPVNNNNNNNNKVEPAHVQHTHEPHDHAHTHDHVPYGQMIVGNKPEAQPQPQQQTTPTTSNHVMDNIRIHQSPETNWAVLAKDASNLNEQTSEKRVSFK